MSWIDLLKKLIGREDLTAAEKSLLRERARAELEAQHPEIFADGAVESQNAASDTEHGLEIYVSNPSPPKSLSDNHAASRKRDRYELLVRGSKRVSVLQFHDWMTVEEAAEQLGRERLEVERAVGEGRLDYFNWPRCDVIVHVRQVAYWLEKGRKLDVPTDIFQGWCRQAEVSRELGIDARVLSAWVHDGEVAVFKPAPRCVLLNVKECATVAKKKLL